MKYPKRLIEVDLPIKRISAHARREKSIRHGHICTLHIWWARRPLAACRAVICASLWPDPADELCPDEFRKTARELMTKWAKDHLKLMSEESSSRFIAISKDDSKLDDNVELRKALLDFIADFANWDNSTVPEYLKTSRALTQAAHEALGGEPGSRPLVVDPFAGGGSIPLEALRVGADAFASDLNPVAVLLNKVVLEYIPKYGQRLADEVRKWGQWIKEQAEKELAEFYPKDPDGATPIAYLWARTIQCEGPGCGAEVPLMRSMWLAKKRTKSVALRIIPRPQAKRVDFKIVENVIAKDVGGGTVARGSATCPVCGYTTPVKSVRTQLKKRRGGADDARMFCVVTIRPGQKGRFYRLPTEKDIEAAGKADEELELRKKAYKGTLSLVPEESTKHYHTFVNRGSIYGMIIWGDYFTQRQLLTLSTFVRLTDEAGNRIRDKQQTEFASAVQTCLAIIVSRHADINASLSMWHTTRELITHVFGRQALGMVWDFAESNSFSGASGAFDIGVNWVSRVLDQDIPHSAVVQKVSATQHTMPDDSANAMITDPPYYYSVQYADLSDFFYVWLRRILIRIHPQLFEPPLTPKDDEIIVQSPGDQYAESGKNNSYYEKMMQKAMTEGRRILKPDAIGIVVFAHTSTAGWEAQLQAMVNSGWTITGSWPIDTEMANRVLAQGRSVLASSIHLVCRPRENADGSLRTDNIGDWRDVLAELPKRIHAWMPRLAEEGVVGADAIFACLGPALEIYSRYSSVEKASGEKVELKEYLEQVWAAVSREALKMIFEGADASGFEEDARLTAMVLWTLRTAAENGAKNGDEGKTKSIASYDLEYDAARKIAQGLGAHLENLGHLVKVKGDTATLLSAGARTRYLFGKDAGEAPKGRKRKKIKQQKFDFMGELKEMEEESGDWAGDLSGRAGSTVLDKLHQSMILFGAGRGEALKRFLVDDGIGMNPLYWRLAQSLSALYPSETDEKRWVDGVLARKKGLGF
ncbi:MAG: DUF1156 domain-containing protein [Pseudomonadota bacterium]